MMHPVVKVVLIGVGLMLVNAAIILIVVGLAFNLSPAE